MDTGLIIFLVMLLAAVPLYVIAYLIGVKQTHRPDLWSQPGPGRRQGRVGSLGGAYDLPHGSGDLPDGLGGIPVHRRDPDHHARRCRADHGLEHRAHRRHPELRCLKGRIMQEPRLTDEVFGALATRGYVIVHNYLPEALRSAMAVALRRILKPWDEIADNPPNDRIGSCYFPYPEQCLNRAIVDREGYRLCPPLARHRPNTLSARTGSGLLSGPQGWAVPHRQWQQLAAATHRIRPSPQPAQLLVLPRRRGRGSGPDSLRRRWRRPAPGRGQS